MKRILLAALAFSVALFCSAPGARAGVGREKGEAFLEENATKQLEAEIMGGAIALSADEARDCAESTYNPRLFNLLWSYYESKVLDREDDLVAGEESAIA